MHCSLLNDLVGNPDHIELNGTIITNNQLEILM